MGLSKDDLLMGSSNLLWSDDYGVQQTTLSNQSKAREGQDALHYAIRFKVSV